MQITGKIAGELLEVLEEVREEFFKGRKQEYSHAEWERKRVIVRERLSRLPEYIKKAVECVAVEKENFGRPETLDLERKTHLFLMARLLNKSNRGMEDMLELFHPLFGFDVSYKYVERLYSDEGVKLVLHNLFVLLLKDEGTSNNFSGDGTGYSLSVENHYRSNPKKRGKKYIHAFKMIDLETGMYVAFGYSRKSEMDAFKKAVEMLCKNGVDIGTISLDKYYSSRKVLRLLGKKVSVFVLPKKNIAHIGSYWLPIFEKIMHDPISFLGRYFKRNLSESGFSADKRRFGGLIRQKREDRQETATFTNALMHNLYAFRITNN